MINKKQTTHEKVSIKILLTSLLIIINLNISGLGLNSNILGQFPETHNIIYVGGTGPGNYSTIQGAINDSIDGDIIFVYEVSSPYYENIIIDKKVHLIGENKFTTTIIGDNTQQSIFIKKEEVKIKGFKIQKTDSNTKYPYYGISVEFGCDNTEIIDNIIINLKDGIKLESDNNQIKNNNFYNCGIYVSKASNDNIIIDNFVNDKRIIYLENKNNQNYDNIGQIILKNCYEITIEDSIISNTLNAILMIKSNACNIKNITMKNSSILLCESNNNIFEQNTIRRIDRNDPQMTAFRLLGSDKNQFLNNEISSLHGYGFYISYSDFNIIKYNDILKSSMGLSLTESDSNKIIENNFIGNVRSAYFLDSKKNEFAKNYWDRPRFIKIIVGSKTIFKGGLFRTPIVFSTFITDSDPARKAINH